RVISGSTVFRRGAVPPLFRLFRIPRRFCGFSFGALETARLQHRYRRLECPVSSFSSSPVAQPLLMQSLGMTRSFLTVNIIKLRQRIARLGALQKANEKGSCQWTRCWLQFSITKPRHSTD